LEPDPPGGRKAVYRWPEPGPDGSFGEICYHLNLDGRASDTVATFVLRTTHEGVTVHFEGIR
jgi:hypothetical protein